jgi:hypothetical protein
MGGSSGTNTICEAEGAAEAEIWREVVLLSTLNRERDRKLPARDGGAAAMASRGMLRWSEEMDKRVWGEESTVEEMEAEVDGGRM